MKVKNEEDMEVKRNSMMFWNSNNHPMVLPLKEYWFEDGFLVFVRSYIETNAL
jgi:hypothetical protein